MNELTLRDMLTDAIRYWEIRRIAFNAFLVGVVAVVFLRQWPDSRSAMSIDLIQSFFIFAVLANVAYCAAYVVDVVVQYSGFRTTWKRYRWILFAIGVVFAGILTRFIATGMFSHAV
jgi:hypothetical protein